MKRDIHIDYFLVQDGQLAIHARLENWSRWAEHQRRMGGKQHPMWMKTISNARQWHEPDLQEPTNQLDGHKVEIAVAQLPHKHRDSLRWNYVFRGGPLNMARRLGVSKEGLYTLVIEARQMLINRRV